MDFSKMTLKEKVLQTFIVTIREINKHGGPEEFFSKYQVGGMYYGYNANTIGKVEEGTGTNPVRLAECKKASRTPLLVCADNALAFGQTIRAELDSVAAIGTEKSAYEMGKIIGMQMNDNGIDWVLHPCIDTLINPTMPLFGWSDDCEEIARLGASLVKGVQDQGVMATIKHFPGNGTTNINMHFGPGRNTLPFDEWEKTYGHIYKTIIDSGVASVMTTHATLESYDNEMHDGFYPSATFSQKLTEELLKKKLNFNGVVVTDAMIMGGNATGDIIGECAMAFKCGADMILWPPVEAADRIVEMIENGEIPMSRLDDALERIARMRKAREEATERTVDLAFVNQKSMEITANGMCLLRNEKGLLPLKDKSGSILIVDAADGQSKSSIMLKEELARRGFNVDIKKDIYDVPSRVCWQSDLDELASHYDKVIFNVDTDFATAWNVPFMLIWASHLFDKNKKIIINYGSPFFAPIYFPEDPTYVEVNCNANEFVTKTLVDKLLGESEFVGKCRLKHPVSTIDTFKK